MRRLVALAVLTTAQVVPGARADGPEPAVFRVGAATVSIDPPVPVYAGGFGVGPAICLVPGLMEALIPRLDESHGSTEEVPRRASRAGDQVGGRGAT